MEETLTGALLRHSGTLEYPFHMPGHKRNITGGVFEQISKIDITEIEGFDNLHDARGIIKREQDFAAVLYQSKSCYYLVNGSSSGVVSAICSQTRKGDVIIMQRGSHKSAYHGVYLNELKPYYLNQPCKESGMPSGPVSKEQVQKALEATGAKVVFLTYPTYEGIGCDIEEIAKIVHSMDAILIVDQAHGAHLGFHSAFMESATEYADLVIMSVHKTLPAMTQTALLHVCSDRVDEMALKRYLAVLQTSSPSYVLMASVSSALHLIQEEGSQRFGQLDEMLKEFYQKAQKLEHLKVLTNDWAIQTYGAKMDQSKIVICTPKLLDEKGQRFRGKDLFDCLLKDYQLQMEMASMDYVLAMTTIMDTKEGINRLIEALFQIDQRLQKAADVSEQENSDWVYCPKDGFREGLSLYEALNGKTEKVSYFDSASHVSGEYLLLYPPGTPLIVPGERISKEVLDFIDQAKKIGLSVTGPESEDLSYLNCLLP